MIGGIDKYFYSIAVERSMPTTDTWGNTIQAWSTLSTIQGLIRQLTGDEIYTGNKDTWITTHRLYCRVSDITTNDRIVLDGVHYYVTNVNNVMNFDELLQVDLYVD